MTANATSASVRVLPLEAGATVEVHLTSSSVRVQGTDAAQLVIRSRNGEPLDREVAIDDAPGRIRIRDAEGWLRLGPIRMRSRRVADIDLEVPRGTILAVRSLSGDLEATGISGASRWTTVSGNMRLGIETGPVALETMAGDLVVTSDGPLAVTARTVSGEVRLLAPRFDALDVATTSGDIRVEGELRPGGKHVMASVSGNVDLATASPVRVDTRSIIGDVKVSGAHRVEGGLGRRTVVHGAGSVPVEIRTTSGRIHVRAQASSPPPVAPSWPSSGAPGTARPELATEPVVDRREAARLEILRALESGEVDVETASHRLEILDDAGPRSVHGWC